MATPAHEAASGGAALGKGFDDPVIDSQRCFRAVLTAMSEPGTIHRLGHSTEQPAGLTPAAAEVLLTLADHETSLWMSPAFASAASRYVRFHCGAPAAEAPGRAGFALIDGSVAEPSLAEFDAGDDRYPDRSTTVIVQCASLSGGEAVSIEGPGIAGSRSIAPAGLHPGFWDEVALNSMRYPLGVDFILAAGAEIMCIPRSTRIERAGEAG
jgi:alpha-D-ribose 1-methylphosphonate 5-triphosphate synthase subunit PhnH